MTKDEAENEMLSGYRDGLDPSTPPPSGNRSYSYRHSFLIGRADNRGEAEFSAQTALKRALVCLRKDMEVDN